MTDEELNEIKLFIKKNRGGAMAFIDPPDAAEALVSRCELLLAEVERLRALVPRWIPVEERLPEESWGPVLVTDGKGVCEGYFTSGKFLALIPEIGDAVTAWMPLPEPEAQAC